jgi:hypothetical protein
LIRNATEANNYFLDCLLGAVAKLFDTQGNFAGGYWMHV